MEFSDNNRRLTGDVSRCHWLVNTKLCKDVLQRLVDVYAGDILVESLVCGVVGGFVCVFGSFFVFQTPLLYLK